MSVHYRVDRNIMPCVESGQDKRQMVLCGCYERDVVKTEVAERVEYYGAMVNTHENTHKITR